MTIASVCQECGEAFHTGEHHKCRPERLEGIAAAVEAGVKHCGHHPITVMMVGGNIQAVAMGNVLFETDAFALDGHTIFSAFMKAWVEAGIADECAC